MKIRRRKTRRYVPVDKFQKQGSAAEQRKSCWGYAVQRAWKTLPADDRMRTPKANMRLNHLVMELFDECLERKRKPFFYPAASLNGLGEGATCEDRSGAILGLSVLAISFLLWDRAKLMKAASTP